MIHNPHAVARLAKAETPSTGGTTYVIGGLWPKRAKAVRNSIVLTPIAWGSPDRELAKVVRTSVEAATPATVIPWAPGQGGLRRRLRSMHVHTDIDDQPVAHVHRFVRVEELSK